MWNFVFFFSKFIGKMVTTASNFLNLCYIVFKLSNDYSCDIQ